jgi:hypothetical protein
VVNCTGGTGGSNNIFPLRDDALVSSIPLQTSMVSTGNQTIYTNDSRAATVTVTAATPCVVSWTSHGLTSGQAIIFTTSGVMPSGILANQLYYVLVAGFTANSFEFATTPTGTAVNTTTTGTGVLTCHAGVWQQPMRVLGYLTWEPGGLLATAGVWSVTPSKIQPFGPGVPLPGQPIQVQRTDTGTEANGTTVLGLANTIPASTAGVQFMTQSITPASAANLLNVRAQAALSSSVANWITAAIFQDAGAAALSCASQYQATVGGLINLPINAMLPAGTLAATTIKLRAGGNAAGTTTFNGTGAAQEFGGALNSFLEITEIMG